VDGNAAQPKGTALRINERSEPRKCGSEGGDGTASVDASAKQWYGGIVVIVAAC
jgi:hypothetical protein